MGHTRVRVKIQNVFDWGAAQDKKERRIRTITIPNALVDTGATYLSLPTRYIRKLGLRPLGRTVPVTTAVGVVEKPLYAGAMLTIEDRTAEFSVLELPDKTPALVGVLVLEALDYMVDPTTEKLVGKHGKKQVILLY